MKKIFVLLLFSLLIISCKKESDNIIWQRSFGEGNALFVMSSPDSGIVACGEVSASPFLIKLSRDKSTETTFTYPGGGLFSSAFYCDSFFIAAGSSEGSMLLSRIDAEGMLVWDAAVTTGFNISLTKLLPDGTDLLAIGSTGPDYSAAAAYGLLFVKFDTSGNIIDTTEVTENEFISVGNAVKDYQGNIYLALTRQETDKKPRASVAKFNSSFQKLWEEELYNNTNFGAGCLGIAIGESDSLYLTGKTEVSREAGTLDNSYLASMSTSGNIGRKKYLENSNSGTDLITNESGEILLLNSNCFIIGVIDPMNGYDIRLIRMYNECDSYHSDAFGADLDLDYDGNILAAGSRGGSFYLALKSSSQ